MLHVTPQSAEQSRVMSKLHDFDMLLDAVKTRRDQAQRFIDEKKQQIKSLQQQIDSAQEGIFQIDKMLGTIEEARQRLAPEFLAALEDIQIPPPDAILGMHPLAPLAPDEVVVKAREVLSEAGKPMRRGQLVDALLKRGVPLAGKDKNKNLGTILWRNSDQFVNLDKLGYWVKGVPLPGVYEPEEKPSQVR